MISHNVRVSLSHTQIFKHVLLSTLVGPTATNSLTLLCVHNLISDSAHYFTHAKISNTELDILDKTEFLQTLRTEVEVR